MTANSLVDYRLLGRSGLRVSPLALGTMTFGQSWGADADSSRAIFDAYVNAGGNFIDTANTYSQGDSEKLIGSFAAGRRDQLVIATKYSLATEAGNPNAAGNQRRNMVRAVEASLRRLNTDYIDLYYLHAWDGHTGVEEIMRGFDDLVRSGKIVYAGISDAPAWQVSRMQMLADLRGWSPFVALQIEYSLIQRTVERELIPMASELGLGVLPWAPLAMGVLSGKYAGGAKAGEGGRGKLIDSAGKLNERAFSIADAVKCVADRNGNSSAEVAIAWTLANPNVTAPIIGARTVDQFQQNLGALAVVLGPEDLAELNAASAIELGFPHDFLAAPHLRAMLDAGGSVRPRH